MISQAGVATLFLLGSIFFPLCFLSLQAFYRKTKIGSEIKKKQQLSDKDCADISVKLVSTLQAILASVCGAIVCSKCYDDVLYCTHPVVLTYAWFGAPYFLYDAMAMFYVSTIADKHYKNINKLKHKRNSKGLFAMGKKFCTFVYKSSSVIVIHHLLMAPCGFLIITYFRGVRGDFFIGVMYLMEASTPFVSFRVILSKLQMKSSLLYKLNGALMLITFPFFRIATVFYTVSLYADQQQLGFTETFCTMHPGWLFVFLASIAPQFYWYYLMLSGLAKILRSEAPKNSELEEPAQTVATNKTHNNLRE